MTQRHTASRTPILPVPLALPFRLIPNSIHSKMLVATLNKILAPEIDDGELDFLEDKIMQVSITDGRLAFRITFSDGKLKAAPKDSPIDLSIEGSIYDYLLLATRQEDPDTLFFNRRLRLGGSTELGLYVKNFLDSLELDDRIGPLLKLMNGLTDVIGKIPDSPLKNLLAKQSNAL